MNENDRYTTTNLATTLEQKGVKQSWIARQVGVSTSFVSKVVAGDRTVDRSTAERISTLLGVPLFLLFELQKRSNTDSETENST